MIGNTIPLTIDVNARGVAALRSQLGMVEGAVGRVGRASGGLRGVMGSIGTGISSIGRGLGRMATSLPGMVGIGFGAAGLVSLIKETSQYESALVSIQLALRLTDTEAAALNDDMSRLAKETGKSKTELLAAARAATDFGVPLDKAIEGMRDAALMATVLGVPLEALAPALGGIEKITGGTLSSRQQMGVLYEAQNASGLPEAALLDLLGKIGPKLAGMTGGEGQGGLAFVMSNIAAVGTAFADSPMKMRKAMDALIGVLLDPNNKKAFDELGIDTKDLAGAQGKLALAFQQGDPVVMKLIKGQEDYFTTLVTAEGGMERFNAVHEATTGDLSESTARVTAALDKMEATSGVAWNQMLEEFKVPLQDAVKGVLAWFVENKADIIESLKGIVSAAKDVAEWLRDWWPLALAAALAGKAIPAIASIAGAGGGVGAAMGGAAAVGAVLGAGVAELFGFGMSDTARTKGETEAMRRSSRGQTAQAERAIGAGSMAESDVETAGYLNTLSSATQRGLSAMNLAGGDTTEAARLMGLAQSLRNGRPIQITVVTSPDGAFTTAVDGATGRTVPTTTTTDGQTAVAAVG